MPQSLDRIVLHIVFSTKNRDPCLGPDVRSALHAYLGTAAREVGCASSFVGGPADHVHMAVCLPRVLTVARLVENVKTSSSKWLKLRSSALQWFQWQRGYGVFSVGPDEFPALERYIRDQDNHHRTHTFQDEYRGLLRRYGIEGDERYMWD